jgi:hypothetical protein
LLTRHIQPNREYIFKYYTDALDTIARLENEDDELEDLLNWCVGAIEADYYTADFASRAGMISFP